MKLTTLTLLLLCVAAPSEGAENAEVVRDGDQRTLPCSSSEGRSYRWKWCRPTSLDRCQSTPLDVEADRQSLTRTFHVNSTTGVYSCVAKADENIVFDVYYQLTAEEWVYISPDQLNITRGDTPTLYMRLQMLKMQLSEVKWYYCPQNDSEEILLERTPSLWITDGVAEYTVNSTTLDDGFIMVKALFIVNSVAHEVKSAVKLTFVEPSTEVTDENGTDLASSDPQLTTGPPLAAIIVPCILVPVLILLAVVAAGLAALVCYSIQRKRNAARRKGDNDSVQDPEEECHR